MPAIDGSQLRTEAAGSPATDGPKAPADSEPADLGGAGGPIDVPAMVDVPARDGQSDTGQPVPDAFPDDAPPESIWRKGGGPVSWTGGAAPFHPPVLGYEEAGGRLFLFAPTIGGERTTGSSRCQGTSPVFEWEAGVGWSPLGETNAPTLAAFGWSLDPAGGRVVFVGGVGCSSGSSFLATGVWALSVTRAAGQPPRAMWSGGASVGQRTGGGVAYDSTRDVMVVFGGNNQVTGNFEDVWELGGTGGTVIRERPAGAPWPPGRAGVRMVFDPHRSRTMMVSEGRSDVWEWDGAAGSWAERPGGGPLPRHGFAVAYDSLRRRMLFFAGMTGSGQLKNDLWEWDPVAGTWTDLTRPSSLLEWPAPRTQHAAAFDSRRNRFVIYGGKGDPAISSEMWEWGP